MSDDNNLDKKLLDVFGNSGNLDCANYVMTDKSKIPYTKTYEEILKFTNDVTIHMQNNSQNDSLNTRDKTTTRIVAIVGFILLILSLILVGVSLSFSDYIDKLVRERHKFRSFGSQTYTNRTIFPNDKSNNQSTLVHSLDS